MVQNGGVLTWCLWFFAPIGVYTINLGVSCIGSYLGIDIPIIFTPKWKW